MWPDDAYDVEPVDRRAWLNSPVFITLLQLVIGGIAGTVIGSKCQDVRSEHDLERAWLQERSRHQLEVRKGFLEEQNRVVERLYGLVGRLHATGENLIDLSKPGFDPQQFDPGESRHELETQKREVRDSFNAAVTEWDKDRLFYRYALNDYTRDASSIQAAWEQAEAAVDQFATCAEERSQSTLKRGEWSRPCVPESGHLRDACTALATALRTSRRMAWHDWENPPPRLR